MHGAVIKPVADISLELFIYPAAPRRTAEAILFVALLLAAAMALGLT